MSARTHQNITFVSRTCACLMRNPWGQKCMRNRGRLATHIAAIYGNKMKKKHTFLLRVPLFLSSFIHLFKQQIAHTTHVVSNNFRRVTRYCWQHQSAVVYVEDQRCSTTVYVRKFYCLGHPLILWAQAGKKRSKRCSI